MKRLKLKFPRTVTPLDDYLTGEVFLTGTTALTVLGADWGYIHLGSPLMVLGINVEPLDELFGKGKEFEDCTKFFKKRGFIPKATKIFCAKPVRAYVEWVYHRIRKGSSFPPEPGTFLFEEDEIYQLREWLYKLCGLIKRKDPKAVEKLREWISSFQGS